MRLHIEIIGEELQHNVVISITRENAIFIDFEDDTKFSEIMVLVKLKE